MDVGANIGNHALYFAITRGAAVHAFEPNPTSRHYLQKSLDANRVEGVIVHAEALSDQQGTASLVESDDLGMVSVAPNRAGEVRLARLDDFHFPGDPRVGLLKIDVEGSEAAVLAGAARTVRLHHPVIAVEAPTKDARRRIEAVLPHEYRRFPVRFCWTSTYVYYPRLVDLVPLVPIAAYAKVAEYRK